MLRIRDDLLLNQKLINEAGKGTAYFVARRLQLAENIRYVGDELVLIAEEIDGRGHSIYAFGAYPTADGAPGPWGIGRPWNPYAAYPEGLPANIRNELAGGDGGPGGKGGEGNPGHSVQIWALDYHALTEVNTMGADGGRGGDGGSGGGGSVLFPDAGWGGNGADGGEGGPGGPGGRLTFVVGPRRGSDASDNTAIWQAGGTGGKGGRPGSVGYPNQPLSLPYLVQTPERTTYNMVAPPGQVVPPQAGRAGSDGPDGSLVSRDAGCVMWLVR